MESALKLWEDLNIGSHGKESNNFCNSWIHLWLYGRRFRLKTYSKLPKKKKKKEPTFMAYI